MEHSAPPSPVQLGSRLCARGLGGYVTGVRKQSHARMSRSTNARGTTANYATDRHLRGKASATDPRPAEQTKNGRRWTAMHAGTHGDRHPFGALPYTHLHHKNT
jgi:hypothetical protein